MTVQLPVWRGPVDTVPVEHARAPWLATVGAFVVTYAALSLITFSHFDLACGRPGRRLYRVGLRATACRGRRLLRPQRTRHAAANQAPALIATEDGHPYLPVRDVSLSWATASSPRDIIAAYTQGRPHWQYYAGECMAGMRHGRTAIWLQSSVGPTGPGTIRVDVLPND